MSTKRASLSFGLGNEQLVMVDCDPAAGRITIDRQRLKIQQGRNVIWCFRGVPDGWTPLLLFQLGIQVPFETVSQSPLVSWGLGAKPTRGPVRYRVALQRGGPFHLWRAGGMVTFSPPASLEVTNVVASANQLPPVLFEVKRKAGVKPEVALVVEPASHKLHDGQIAEWRFDVSCFPDGKPERWQSSVLFTRFRGRPGAPPDLAYGPFEMISTSPGLVVGSGNNEVVGFYHFQVLVVSLEHGDVAFGGSDDPSIDNRDGIDG